MAFSVSSERHRDKQSPINVESQVKCVIIMLKHIWLAFNHINNFFVNVANDLVSELPNMTDFYSAFSDNCKSFYGKKGIIPGMFRLQGVSYSVLPRIEKGHGAA